MCREFADGQTEVLLDLSSEISQVPKVAVPGVGDEPEMSDGECCVYRIDLCFGTIDTYCASKGRKYSDCVENTMAV